jgi:hypothetical protein
MMGNMPPGMSQPMPGMPPMGGPMSPPIHGYPGTVTGLAPTPALEAPLPLEGQRRSSIMRDIAIGVAIAAVVLGSFLLFKHFVLDAQDAPDEAASPGQGDLLITMPGITSATLYIDDNQHMSSVGDGAKVPVTAGKHKVKLVGSGNQQCEKEITVVASEVFEVECGMKPEDGGGTGSAGAGSSAGAGATGAGSAGEPAKAGPDDKTVAKPDEAADKAAADKAAADKAAADKAAADRAAVDKAAADKAAADKAAADKAAADKAKADKLKKPPLDENPADRAGPPAAKGWVQITSKPSARIFVNGNDTNLTTPITGRALALPAGRHRVTFQIGNDKYTFSVVVKAGETVILDKNLQ